MHHNATVGGILISYIVIMSDLFCDSGKLIMDTKVSLQVSLDRPRDSHLWLVCLLHLTVCVLDSSCPQFYGGSKEISWPVYTSQ